jgi:CRP/FNR family cyclic AMP-dependent transcriptional regulator
VIDALRKISLFQSLSDAELETLAAAVVVHTYPKHTIIVSEGDRSDALYLILAGRVQVYVSDESTHELVLNIQGPGDHFGEMVLDDGPRSASVVTLEPCRLAMLTRERFRAHLATHPEVAMTVIRSLIRRCRALTDTARDLALLDVYGRLAKLLLSLAEPDASGRLVVSEHLTKRAIGERIGASREMVSRILKDLGTGGYISTENGKMIIKRKPPANW